MHIDRKRKLHYIAAAIFLAAAVSLAGCGKNTGEEESQTAASSETETAAVWETLPQIQLPQMTPDGPIFPDNPNIVVPIEEPAPEYLRLGTEHSIVAELQQRLMDLGFMDNDEPTWYFGNITESAVKTFQRQNKLTMDGIVGPETLAAIMSPDAKYYAVSNGESGEDIKRIQNRLYELGYLASADLVTGNFGDKTEEAVLKLQNQNGITEDGKVGHQTLNLMYSDEVKANLLSYGEKSEVVLACQERLKELGYLTTTPDGAYGDDTAIAVKQFQSRNDLVVDGYLGPSTRIALMSSSARANGLVLGESGASVTRVQQLLNKYGYLSSSHVTGYFGEKTEAAVRSFQSNNGLTVDGSVGRQTMNKLTGENVKKATAGSSSSGSSGSGSSSGSSSSGSSSGSSGSQSGTVKGGSGVNGLISIAQSKVGSPYVYGAKGPNSFDCSGFVYWCLNQAGVRQSYLTSSGWRNVGKYTKITNFGSLQAGDIVVVRGHVGIAAGGGQVIDASSSHGRVVQRGLSSWWANNFICGWRIFE